MKKLLLILLCLPMIGFGQEWTYGGTGDDIGHSVQQTTDGGYIIAGTAISPVNGGSDVYLIKTDGNGIEQWSQALGATDFDEGHSVQQTTDGGYIITGRTSSANQDDVYLIKTDGNGIEQWSQTFGGTGSENGHSVQQTTDGGYIITGWASSFGNGQGDVYLIKTDDYGVEQWHQTFGGTDSENGYSVEQATDGGYIIAGWTSSFGTSGLEVYLIKTDGNGAEQWSQTLGAGAGRSVQQTTDGGYIVCGTANLIKTDGNGVEQWSQAIGGFAQQATDGGYIIAGTSISPVNGGYDVCLIKTDGNGVVQWIKYFGGTGSDGSTSVQQTTDGGYIITGVTDSFGNGEDVYLIKTDGNGNVTSTFNIPINPNRKLEKTVDILGRDIKPQTNTPLIEIYDDGTVEKRIVIE